MNFSADVSLVAAHRLTYGSILPPIENQRLEERKFKLRRGER